MNTPEKYHHAQQNAAGQAVHELRILAINGNAEAVAAIRDIALHAIGILEAIDLGDVPKHSWRWPVVYDAILERRKSDMERAEKLEVGTAIGIQLTGKRVFKNGKPTELARELFQQIEPVRQRGESILGYLQRHPDSTPNWRDRAAILPPLSKDSLNQWVEVAIEVCLEIRMGDWSLIPLPECAKGKVGKDPSGDGWIRTAESAVLGKISEGLKALIPKPRPQK